VESVEINALAPGGKLAATALPTFQSLSKVSSVPTTPRTPLVPNSFGISDLFSDIIISSFDKILYLTLATFINSF
jgi:hypothetical protein